MSEYYALHVQLCLLVGLLLISNASSTKRYTLRGDPEWPNAQEIAAFAQTLSTRLRLDTDSDYRAPATWNLRTNTPRPSFVVNVTNVNDIVTSLEFARKHALRVSVRSTGHHQDARNSVDQSLLLDMSAMSAKSIDVEKKLITVGPGNHFADIHPFVKVQSNSTLVVISGADADVGPAGWVLGGGHGRLTRMFGLGVDVLVSVNLVLANGTDVTASEDFHPDLFRALRGSGGSTLGIIYSLTFRLFDDPGPVSTFLGIYGPSDSVADGFQSWMKAAPNNAGGYYILAISDTGQPYVLITAHCIDSPPRCATVLAPLVDIPGCVIAPCTVQASFPSYTAYAADQNNRTNPGGTGAVYLASTALNFSVSGQLASVTRWLASYTSAKWPNAVIGCSGNAVLGGASSFLDPMGKLTAVSPAMRQSVMAITCYVAWAPGLPRPDLVSAMDEWAETSLRPLGVDGWVYWNEPQHNFPFNDWRSRYWGGDDAYNQLLAVKRMYDPSNVLTCYHCLGWEDVENTDLAVCPNGCECSNVISPNTCISVATNR